MAYFYRVFATVKKDIWGDEIDSFLEESKLGFTVYGVVDEEDAEKLDAVPISLVFMDEKERKVAELFYDETDDPESDLLAKEIEEFHGIVDEMLPEVNRAWAHEQLNKTVACYAFKIEKACFEAENWDRLSTIAEWLRSETEGFEQSDSGLITNEDGAIALEVPDDVELDDEVDEELVDEEYIDDEDEYEETDGEELDGGEDDEDDFEEDDEEDEEWESFEAAVRKDGQWVVKEITSEEERQAFLNGNV